MIWKGREKEKEKERKRKKKKKRTQIKRNKITKPGKKKLNNLIKY